MLLRIEMVFICPKCSRKTLKISSSLELPADSRSDEIAFQILDCSNCNFKGLGVFEESRRGTIDSDSFDHRGYIVDYAVLESLKEKVLQCSQPKNPKCDCLAHRYFYRVNRNGRWNFLDEVKIEGVFSIKIS